MKVDHKDGVMGLGMSLRGNECMFKTSCSGYPLRCKECKEVKWKFLVAYVNACG